jgi:hypothetical protein
VVNNSTGVNKTVTFRSYGYIKWTVRWIGLGAAPNDVVVKITSTATAGGATNGSKSASNGLGNPETMLGNTKVSQGSKYRLVKLSGNVGTVQILAQAQSLMSGNASSGYNCSASSNVTASCVIADRAIRIYPWVSPTYHLGADALPEVTDMSDPENEEMDTVATPVDANNVEGAWRRTTDFYAQQQGFPAPLSLHWSNGSSLFIAYPTYNYSWADILSMSNGGPRTENLSVTASTPVDSITRTSLMKIRVHAPAESITATSDERVYTPWTRFSAEELMNPGQTPFAIPVTLTSTTTTTKNVTLTASGEVSVPIKIFTVKLGGSGQQSWGESAALAISRGVSFETNAVTVPTFFWVERRAFWRSQWGWFHAFAENGYREVGVYNYVYWESGTKVAAELADAQDRLQSRPSGIQ